jgi:hypothetical protein
MLDYVVWFAVAFIIGVGLYTISEALKAVAKALEGISKAISEFSNEKQALRPYSQQFSESPKEKSKGTLEVAELSPEQIGQLLKKPPRPSGGFGSRSNKSDDDT